MARWIFEPGHTAAEFRARHMMVTYVRGHFKNVHGSLEFDADSPRNSSIEVQIDAREIWTGVKEGDDHLRSADFLDVDHPRTKKQSGRQNWAQHCLYRFCNPSSQLPEPG